MSIRFIPLSALILLIALSGCSKNTRDKSTDVVDDDQANVLDSEQEASEDRNAPALEEESDADEPDAFMASRALQQFGTSLFEELHKSSADDNLAISPWSVESALVMTAAGAKGHTLAQMLYALGFVQLADNPDAMQTSFAALSQELLKNASKSDDDEDDDEDKDDDDNELILHAANAIWVAHQLHQDLRGDFEQTLKDTHAAEVHDATFQADAEGARKKINQWIFKNTDEKIKDLLPRGSVNADTSIVLTNAIAFDADWSDAFDKKNTKKKKFTRLNNKTVDVDLMHRKFQRAAYWQSDDFHAVALPYESGNYVMSIVVPSEGKFADVRTQLFEDGFESVFVPGEKRATEIVNVYLPRFKFRWKQSLTSALKSLGMEHAFDDRADFSKMFKTTSHRVSDVIHEVFIDVDEEGTEAAAATGVIVSTTSARVDPPKEYEVRADRPFLFAIHDTATHSPIFLGQVTDPTKQ